MSTVPPATTSPPADRTTLQKGSESDGSFDQTPVVSGERPFHKLLEDVKKQSEDHRKAVEELGRTVQALEAQKDRREQIRRQVEKNMAECRSAERFICATLMTVAIAAVAAPTGAAVPPENPRLPQQSEGRGRGPRRTNGLQ